MNFKWTYVFAFVLAVGLATLLSMPTRLTRAEMSRDSGNLDETITILSDELTKSPDNVYLAIRLAEALHEGEREGDALELLRESYEKHPDSPALQKALALQYATSGRVREALRTLPEELRDRDFYLLCAAQTEKTGDLRSTERMLLAAWGEDNQKADIWLKIASLRRDQYNLEGEAEALRRVIAFEPDSRDGWDFYFLNRAWLLDSTETLRAAKVLEGFGPLDRSRLETILSFQISEHDLEAAAATSEKITSLPEATYQNKVDFAYLQRRRNNDQAADQLMLTLLRDPELPEDYRTVAFESLRDSAYRNSDLDLAMRLTEIPASPEQRRENAAFAASLVLDAGMTIEAGQLLQPLLADPEASPEILAVGFELARRTGDNESMQSLAERLIRAGADLDEVVFGALDSDRAAWEWRREIEKNPALAANWLGLARASLRESNLAEAKRAVDTAVDKIDFRDPISGIGLLEILLSLANREPEGSAEREARVDEALAVIEGAAGGPMTRSRWFVIMAADAYARKGDKEKADEYWNIAATLYPDDFWSWIEMGRAAARRGDENAVETILGHLDLDDAVLEAANIRGVADIYLTMADYYEERNPVQSRLWTERATQLVNDHRELLPPTVRENLALFADVAERSGDWRHALDYWTEAATLRGGDVASWLGVARAAQELYEADTAWNALHRADALIERGNYELRITLAWQLLAVADSLREDDPSRQARQIEAESYAEDCLGGRWDPNLAAYLVWKSAQRGDMAAAESILARLESTGEQSDPVNIRSIANAQLNLVDYFADEDPARSRLWLQRATDLIEANRDRLSPDVRDNVLLFATIGERNENWTAAFEAWRAAAAMPGVDASTWLGVARSAMALDDVDSAWDALMKADALVERGNFEQKTQIAWQLLAAAGATAPDDPRLEDRRRAAEKYTEECLRARWDPNLASSLVWAATQSGGVAVAEAVLARLEETREELSAANIRSVAYAELAMADYYAPIDQERAAAWIERATRLVEASRPGLDREDRDNLVLLATIAERNEDWAGAIGFWNAATELRGGDAQSWLGMARTTMAQGNPDAAWEALLKADVLVERGNYEQKTQIAWQLLAVAGATPEDSSMREFRQRQAEAYAEECLGGRWDADLAASLVLAAAQRGDVGSAEEILGRLETAGGQATAANVRSLVYAQLALADYFAESDPAEAQNRIDKAAAVVLANRERLSLEVLDNVVLLATVGERTGDWRAAYNYWRLASERNGGDVQSWLGVARTAAQLEDSGAAWAAAEKARAMVERNNFEQRAQVAWQLLAAANATPEGSPDRPLRQSAAEAYIGDCLADNWDADLAATLVYSSTQRGDVRALEDLLARFEAMGRQTNPVVLRSIGYAQLAIADHYAPIEPTTSKKWLDKAADLLHANAERLPLGVRENVVLFADVAERRLEWADARRYWTMAAGIGDGDVVSWLGVSRAAIALDDPDGAWEALGKADGLLPEEDFEQKALIAWQLIAAANATGETDPARPARLAEAESYGNAALASLWNPDLASTLVWMATQRSDAEQAEALLLRLETEDFELSAASVRNIASAQLALADLYAPDFPERAKAWVDKATAFVVRNRSILSPADRENMILFATVAERNENWRLARDNWLAAASADEGDAASWLGVARTSLSLEEPDAAWAALIKADAKVERNDFVQRTAVAWQLLAATAATPEDSSLHAARQNVSVKYAEQCLAGRWDPDLAVSLVWLAAQADDIEKAESYLRGRADPPLGARAILAESYLGKGRTDEALREARAAAGSDDRAIRLRMATVLGQAGYWDESRDLVAAALTMPGEETADYLVVLGNAYGAIEEYDKQFEVMDRRAAAGGEAEWFDAVDRRIWAGKYEEALTLLAEVEKRYPTAPGVVERALIVLTDSNRPGQVLDVYERALRVDPDLKTKLSADALACLGVAARDVRMPARARGFFRDSLEKEPANRRASMGIARLLLTEGKMQAAMGALRDYTEANADDPWGWLELANAKNAASQTGRPEYRKVVELTPPRPDGQVPRSVRAARAVALRQLGREKEALAILRSAVDATITDPNIACDYAQMLMDTGRYDECDEILRETVKLFPYHVWAYRLEATSLVRRRKYDLAVARLKEALVWSPDDGEVQRDLGFAAQMWERTWQSQKGWLSAGGR